MLPSPLCSSLGRLPTTYNITVSRSCQLRLIQSRAMQVTEVGEGLSRPLSAPIHLLILDDQLLSWGTRT